MSDEPEYINTSVLVGDILGFDPSVLASMNPSSDNVNDKVMMGLQAFMRKVLQLAIQAGEHKNAALRLLSDKTGQFTGGRRPAQ